MSDYPPINQDIIQIDQLTGKITLSKAWQLFFQNLKTSTNTNDELVSEVYSTSDVIERAWPVGSVFISVVDTNPSALIGYGTWASFGAGKVIVGVDPSDTDFNTVEKTGGSKTHDHPSTTSGQPSAVETVDNDGTGTTVDVGSETHTHDVDLAAIAHIPPYITVYLWKRTA